MKNCIWIVFGIFVTHIGSAAAQVQDRVTDKLLTRFDQLIQGEFDNYNQINFENNDFLLNVDKLIEKHARLYRRVVKINAPTLGKHVYYHQIHSGGKDKAIYRQNIQIIHPEHSTHSIVADNFTIISPDDFNGRWFEHDKILLSLKDLKLVGENCQSTYKQVGNSFVGGINKKRCKVNSKKFGYLNLSTQQVISPKEFWHLEEGFLPSGKMLFGRKDGIPHKLRRAINFTCWAAFKTDKKKANGEPFWDFVSNVTIHNQGDIAEFSTTETIPKHYFIRLKETVFPAGKRSDVFEMFIHENTKEAKTHYTDALSYTWTNSGAERLGINLRWMQASCSINKEK